MTMRMGVHDPAPTETARVAAARAGDEGAFGALTLPLQREIHVHCYRMLGSLDDADDALQETLLRAWRQIDHFEPRAPFRAWLYRIATNVCLTMLTRRTRRREVTTTALAATGHEASDALPLDPYPDRLLDELAPFVPGPETTIEHRESVELAFVAAVQLLPPRQRAALLLCDVLGYTAAEVAAMLETSVAEVNSVHQRARSTLAKERTAGRVTHAHARSDTATEQRLVRNLSDAWHAADVPAIVALLTEDALFTMPPQPVRHIGREAIALLLATGPGGGRLDRFRLIPTHANRQPAVAAYFRDSDDGLYRAYAVFVFALAGEAIASLVRFADPGLFVRFGLPTTHDG